MDNFIADFILFAIVFGLLSAVWIAASFFFK
jgi:hypothetical protein